MDVRVIRVVRLSDTAVPVAVGSILRLRLGLGNTVTVWAGFII